ncbi:hypothetical protein MAHJHV33_50130 [Mycobacterium avium subsp. hominissuis]
MVTPMVHDFVARVPNGQNYRVIDNVAVPCGIGAPPNGVVYNDGMQDVLMWTSNVPSSAPAAHS